jgi:DNA helicase-2/ATP-dependent DNA helicase PcrA
VVAPSRIAPAPGPPREQSSGVEGFLERAEVRDVLAWMRLLIDPHDAAAVVRALARPPIELRQVHLALVIQLARRRKMDLVEGLRAATESPQVPPEARERIQRFIALHHRVVAELDTLGPDVFIASLIELLRGRGRSLLAPEEAAEQSASLDQLREMSESFARRTPGSTPRELAAHLAAVAPGVRWSRRARAEAAAPAEPAETQAPIAPSGHEPGERQPDAAPAQDQLEPQHDAAPAPDQLEQQLEACLLQMRAEVLESVSRIGGRLGELRLDTELDIAHGVVRYLELLKLAALLQRGAGQELAEGLADINARLLAATTPLQREILQSSTLDDTLVAGAPRPRVSQREERSLGPFLPRKGVGLALSASDIETYRSCPLRYKFSRVLRIPTEQTLQQRFGITVHQVLERFHGEGAGTLPQMLELLDAGWRRAGLGDGEEESRLHELARTALARYHARLREQQAEPVWFERSFAFRLGPHHLRGRVDRVDRLAGPADDAPGEARYELIDYKTSRPRTAAELSDDVQLSLYALAAREAWKLESSQQAYYYVLDDRKVPVPRAEHDGDSIKDTVLEVGEGILAEAFEPTPSPAACSLCGYRIVCPAAEA